MGNLQDSSRRKSGNKHKSSKPASTSTSPFITLTTSLYLPLSPCAFAHPLAGLLAEHLSPHLMSYYPPFNGVLLSYSNPRISTTPSEGLTSSAAGTLDGSSGSGREEVVLARSIAEYAVTYLWLTASFLIFRPERGCLLTGTVNLQSESMLGLLCYNYFNVAVTRENLPETWSWDAEGEVWRDGEGGDVQGRSVRCEVLDFESAGGEGLSIGARVVVEG